MDPGLIKKTDVFSFLVEIKKFTADNMSKNVDFDLRVGQTGIRSGELITSAVNAKQSRGVVIEILGDFPTDRERVNDLSITEIRDKLNLIPFFAPMTPNQRQEWLIQHSDPRKDLYQEDTDISDKFLSIDVLIC